MATIGNLEVPTNTYVTFMLVGATEEITTCFGAEISHQMVANFGFIAKELWDGFYSRLSSDERIVNDHTAYPWYVCTNPDGKVSIYCSVWIIPSSVSLHKNKILWRMEWHGDKEAPIKLKEIAKRMGILEYSIKPVGE